LDRFVHDFFDKGGPVVEPEARFVPASFRVFLVGISAEYAQLAVIQIVGAKKALFRTCEFSRTQLAELIDTEIEIQQGIRRRFSVQNQHISEWG